MHTSEHRAEASKRLTPLGKRYFALVEFDDEEELLAEIRKHWFGLFLVELTGIFVTLAILVATLTLGSNLDILGSDLVDTSGAQPVVLAIGLVLTVFSIIGAVIATVLYQSNVIFITDQKLAQVLYISLFNRKISQLSIGDIQDVTVVQRGIFPRIFNYGTLVIETAGEQQNLSFTYVPKPYESSQTIVGAHEDNLKKYGN